MSHRTKTPVVAPRVQQQPSVGVEVEGDDTDHHPAVVAFLSVAAGGLHNKKKSTSKASTNPATAGASSSTSSPRYPYTSVSFSPCRRYAVIAGKELLQIVRVGPKGLRLVQTIPTAAYFQQKQHQQPSDPRGRTIPPQDSGFLNLRDFARGVGQQQQQQQQSPQSASSSTGGGVNAIMNIVVTDVAWSSGIVPSKSNEDLLLASSSDDEQQGHDGFGSIGNLPGDRQHHQLQTSLIAAAGSNGVIVVWSAALLLGLPTHADGDTPGNSKNNEAVQKSPTAPVVQQPEAELSKHTRQVNRLAWHPTKHGLLLSASQDGSVLLWERIRRRNDDLVDKKSVSADSLKNKPNRFQGLFGGLTQQHQQQQQQLSDAGTLVQPLHLKHQRFQQQQQQYQWQCRATFTPKSEAVRDLRWSPFYDDVFALVTTSGSLIVYNHFIAARAVVKIAAHSGDASTLDWHPTRPNVIATGGASDRSVKVWDLSEDLLWHTTRRDDSNVERNSNTGTSKGESVGTNESSGTGTANETISGFHSTSLSVGPTTSLTPISYASRTMSSMSSSGFGSALRHKGIAKRMLHVLSISASVTRLRWRPPSNELLLLEDEDRHDAMMAVATAPIKGASAGGYGVLALWSYKRPFMPLSVVEGHREGAVADFDWLDTPQEQYPKRYAAPRQDEQLQPSFMGATGRRNRKGRALSLTEESTPSRLPGPASHEIDSILYDNSEAADDFQKPVEIWQHVLSVGRDGRCLMQSFVRGDRPISRVPQSCFTMANLSPFQKGYGSLQLFSVYQEVPSRQESDFLLTGLRVDEAATMAPGIFKEKSATAPKEEISNSISFPLGWQIGKRFPVTSPKLIFHVLDQGNLDQESNPIDHKKFTTIVIAPEVVHLSRFANRYRFYIDSDFPSRANLCLHNGEVAAKLSQYALAHMWRMIATMLGSTGIDGLPTSSSKHPQNMMQFVMVPTIRSLLEERADAGDVQTCVAVSEILQLVQQDQTVRISGIEIELIREWYLSYIDLLRDMCLFSQATNLIRNCKDPFIGALHHQSTTIHEACQHCGKPLLLEDGPACDQKNAFARRVCKSCRRRVGLCFICHEPVKGVYVWCPGCGHGGHLEHSLQWFGGLSGDVVREMCPTGCGHRCNSLRELSAFPKTESFHERQFDYCPNEWNG